MTILSTNELSRLNVSTEQEVADLKDTADELFVYHPWDEAQQIQGQHVRDTLKEAFKAIVKNVESGPMRTRALNMVLDCRMLANQAITFPGR